MECSREFHDIVIVSICIIVGQRIGWSGQEERAARFGGYFLHVVSASNVPVDVPASVHVPVYTNVLAPQSGAHRRDAFRDFYPTHPSI